MVSFLAIGSHLSPHGLCVTEKLPQSGRADTQYSRSPDVWVAAHWQFCRSFQLLLGDCPHTVAG